MHNFQSKILVLIIISLTIFIIKCQKSQEIKGSLPIEEKTFVELYTEIMLIKTRYPRKEDYQPKILPILIKNNLNKEKYEEIITFYQSNSEQWLLFLDKVNARLEKLKEEHEGTVR